MNRQPVAIEMIDNEPDEQLEVLVDGELAGLAEYQRKRGIIAFMHTETRPEFKGQGYARKLIEHALDQAREQELWVLPFCPFVVKIVAERPEYLALVPGDLRANFDLPVS